MSETLTEAPEKLLERMGKMARAASTALAKLRPDAKNRALLAIADAVDAARAELATENARDIERAPEFGLTPAQTDRLRLTDKRIDDMVQALRDVAELPDPVGEIYDMRTRPNGLRIGKMRAPLGVIGIIYESRPNVTVDAAALCVKSGNAVILRGGKEAFYSNTILARIMNAAGVAAGLPEGAVQLIPTTDRAAVGAMLTAAEYIDIIIPRGGKSLIERVSRESVIPVIKHLDGVCHVYVDEHADLESAAEIALNAKVQRPGVCNAMENLVVHRAVADTWLPPMLNRFKEAGVEIRGCETTRALWPDAAPATDADWDEEYLELVLAVKVVDDYDAAVVFINAHGSQHTDTIVTRDHDRAMNFLTEIDSACVFINCSTRFSDGAQFGMGCEIGISTDKLHARGPMGLVELTTSKFIVFGQGQIRE